MRQLISIISILCLSGCSSMHPPQVIQNRSKQYLSAYSIPTLKTPPGSSYHFKARYPVPNREYKDAAKEVSLVPQGL
jgi:uncharacterized lipoprotein